MYSTQYRTPPPGYSFDYRQTPSPNARSSYYSARFGTASPKTTPSSSKHRRASQSQSYGYGYGPTTTPPPPNFYAAYGPSPDYYASYASPRHNSEYVPRYTAEPEPTVHRSRARRASHGARPKPEQPSSNVPPKARAGAAAAAASAAKPAARKATDEDARRAGIPAGYSTKNWDPAEEPIMLLGSVFDANSLGKWIYDWTVFHHGASTPMTDIAGDLWLLLIQLAGKVKRAEECLPRIRRLENKELVEDFLEAGERLWDRFGRLLKVCEGYMWKAARRPSGEKKNVTMGKNSGCEFVDSMFGRDRQLENSEKLMTGIRLWSMRFDANCEEILRRPHL